MPYPYYNPSANLYGGYNPPVYQNPAPAPAPAPAQAQAPSAGLIWVQGEAGAKSYLVAPGATILLMDSEAQKFYLKSADSSGMPMPLRTFEYKEVGSGETVNFDKYVTKDEFERRIAALMAKEQHDE